MTFPFPFLDTNPCHDNPCENHGHCTHNGKNEISCVCQNGFRGDRCAGNILLCILIYMHMEVVDISQYTVHMC